MNPQIHQKKRKLPIPVVFTPGKKLGDLLCSSRPYDKARCTIRNCRICVNLENNVTCTVKYPIYLITCNLCQETYYGESRKSLHDRLVNIYDLLLTPLKAVTKMKPWQYTTAIIITGLNLICLFDY